MPGPLAARLQAPLQRLAVRFGLQAFIGLFCLLAILSPPAVWNALSLLDANVTPVYAIVSFAVCLQPNVGAALFIGLQRIVGVLVGGALGVAATYIAYAANGHTFEDSVTKGAVMVTILAVWTFAIGCYRAKYTRFPFAFTVCAFSAPMVALSGFHLDYVEDKVIFYWWMQALIGVTASSLVSMLIFPNLASTGVKKTTQSSLEELGRATMQLVSLLFPTTQGLQGANVIPSDAMDLYLETYGTPIAAGLQKARAALLASWTEVDVYNRPHLFPRNAYGVLLSLLRHYLSTLSTLSYLLSGEAPLKAAQSLRKPVSEVATGIQETLAAAATCLRGDSDITYLDVLRCLTQLEGSLHELGRIRAGSPTEHLSTEQMRQRHSSTVGQPRSCADGSDATADVKSGGDGYTEGEILVADTILAVMFSLGTFVRQLCFVLPEAIHHPGPECRKAWRKHFNGSKWDFDEEGNDHRHPTLRASAPTSPAALHRLASLTASLPSPREVNTLSEREAVVLGASNGKDTNSGSIASSGGLPGSSPRRLPQKAFPQLILADSGVIQRSPKNSWVDGFAEDFFAFIERGLGLRRAHLVAGFQCAICLAAAATLHVCNASYRALGEKTIWVVVTVLVMFQSTIGGILLRGVNRIVATVVAGLLGVSLMYLVYAINGLSYANDFLKFGAMCVLFPAFEGIINWRSAQPHELWAYGWMVLRLTLPIATLVGYSTEVLEPKIAMWRVINVVIGAGIDTLIGCAFLPVTTRSAVNLVMDGILHHLVEISAATADLLTPEGAESLSKDFSRAASTLSGNSSKFFEPLTTTSTLPSPREVELTGVPLAQPSEAGTPVDVEAGVRLQLVDGRQNVAVVEPMNAPLPSPFSRLPAIHIEPTTASPGSASPNARSPASPASPTAMYYAAESPRKLSVRRERSKWIKRKALGGPAMQLRPMWLEVSEGLSVLKELSAIAEFEEKLLPRCVRTVTVQDVASVRLVLRRMLNVLLSFSYMLRGGDVPHLRLLVPFYPHIEAVLAEIAECLKATAAMAAGRLQEEKIVATHHALDEQIQTLLAEVESTPPPLNCSQADAVLGYASLGVLVAAVQTVEEVHLKVAQFHGKTAAVPHSMLQPQQNVGGVEAAAVAAYVAAGTAGPEEDMPRPVAE